jgi:AhpD family alkylhydroperoxidase
MSEYPVHTPESAPAESKALLQGLQAEIGFIPNLAASMAESPELLKGFLTVRDLMDRGTFRQGEIQVLALTNAFENGCPYCMSLHSTFALSVGVSADAVEALREGREPDDDKLGSLSRFSRRLVRERGHVSEADLAAFLEAGYTKRQALEVVLQVAASIMPNFAHRLTECPVDEAVQGQLWTQDAHASTSTLAAG